jgi:L-ascorbate metabolism protein UlaG (beta-lactamase superfamily)
MRITYQGHSCFILSSGDKSVIIDPFLDGNPFAKIRPKDVEVDAVLVTHGHDDHLGSAVEIARNNDVQIIAPFELVNYCMEKGAKGHPMHIGGAFNFPFGRVKLTIAHHGSTTDTGAVGSPCGMLVEMDGKCVYHAGDTGLFSDMSLIGTMNDIDCALLPIGDNFTMGIVDALVAAKMLNAKKTVPMHYNTFDVIEQDPEEFIRGLSKLGLDGATIEPGESIDI